MSSTAGIGFEPITTAIGAVVTGIDMREEQSAEAVALVRAKLLEHGVLFFRGQATTPDELWRYSARFGIPLKDEATGTEQDTSDMLRTNDMSPSRNSTATWHADTTSLAAPPWATMLRAEAPPPWGGDTCFAQAQLAYELLSDSWRAMLDGLTAVHSIGLTFERMGQLGPYFQQEYEPRHAREQVHPVVLEHPESGRKGLFVSETFTTRIVEMSAAESAAVLGVLFRQIERPECTMRWKWQAGDVAFWDNRAVQHYAVPDYDSARVMQRIVLQGVRPGGAEAVRAAA